MAHVSSRVPWIVFLGMIGTSCRNDDPSAAEPTYVADTVDGTAPSSFGDTDGGKGEVAETGSVVLQMGSDVPRWVAQRVEAHLRRAAVRPLLVLDATAELDDLPSASLVIGLGDTTATRRWIPEDALEDVGPQGFRIRSGMLAHGPMIVVDGNPRSSGGVALGLEFGVYRVLETLGFSFGHPLEPHVPAGLPTELPAVARNETPRWPVRGVQLHTMHPLELTHLLQGWGPGGPDDRSGWESLLPEWDAYLEWMLANGQERTHWVLLGAPSWRDMADSTERFERLKVLVERGRRLGLRIGIDVPIALSQQHAWRLVRHAEEGEDALEAIRSGLDQVMSAGFDYVVTEAGTTEFTAPEAEVMLAWMNALAVHLDEAHERPAWIKVHASTGQRIEARTDPVDGGPLDFNYLPHYADPRLGVLPHTVQHWGLDDRAPTYGNDDFSRVEAFLASQVGRRSVVWHPESSYWVGFDIDVPLFLPIYAERRLADLRRLARAEDRGEYRGEPRDGIDGQLLFSSGWEWGYWMNDVVAARAAWNPELELSDDEALRRALQPIVAPFGEAADRVTAVLLEAIELEHELVLRGCVEHRCPEEIERRNGQAYLQGFDALDDVSELVRRVPGVSVTMTQPRRLGLVDMRNPLHEGPEYSTEVEPLLAEMASRFEELAEAFERLRPEIPRRARPRFEEFVDGARITALRAKQVHALYDYVEGTFGRSEAWRQVRLSQARQALDEARTVVARRERSYRVDPDRIAGWGTNPTAYAFGYLWPVRSLYYWWRDELKAVAMPLNPCALNIVNPVAVGVGQGALARLADAVAAALGPGFVLGAVGECLGVPVGGPRLPPAGLRPGTDTG